MNIKKALIIKINKNYTYTYFQKNNALNIILMIVIILKITQTPKRVNFYFNLLNR